MLLGLPSQTPYTNPQKTPIAVTSPVSLLYPHCPTHPLHLIPPPRLILASHHQPYGRAASDPILSKNTSTCLLPLPLLCHVKHCAPVSAFMSC